MRAKYCDLVCMPGGGGGGIDAAAEGRGPTPPTLPIPAFSSSPDAHADAHEIPLKGTADAGTPAGSAETAEPALQLVAAETELEAACRYVVEGEEKGATASESAAGAVGIALLGHAASSTIWHGSE